MKSKQLKLKPSARDKRRYLLIDEKSNEKIEETLLKYLGIIGFAKTAYLPVKHHNFKNKTIGSCLRKELLNVKTALTFEGIKIEKVTETIKRLQESS